MHPYKALAHQVGTTEANELAARLASWHDAMVNHERRLNADGQSRETCDTSCPHEDAVQLWQEARQTFGSVADNLAFLRSRATSRE
jgi:hypothetical protein